MRGLTDSRCFWDLMARRILKAFQAVQLVAGGFSWDQSLNIARSDRFVLRLYRIVALTVTSQRRMISFSPFGRMKNLHDTVHTINLSKLLLLLLLLLEIYLQLASINKQTSEAERLASSELACSAHARDPLCDNCAYAHYQNKKHNAEQMLWVLRCDYLCVTAMKYSNMTHTTCCPKVSVSWTRPPVHRPPRHCCAFDNWNQIDRNAISKINTSNNSNNNNNGVTNYEVL